uniref:Uncharacterized protein n=1 Tax=Oryza nivara TaxID=4536 RepID=A0A0E0GB31_ORYNI
MRTQEEGRKEAPARERGGGTMRGEPGAKTLEVGTILLLTMEGEAVDERIRSNPTPIFQWQSVAIIEVLSLLLLLLPPPSFLLAPGDDEHSSFKI